MKSLFVYLKRKYGEPEIFADIAELLRDGNDVVAIKYRSNRQTRYYTGSGQRFGKGRGKCTRWNVHVEVFNETPDFNNLVMESAQYVWNDPKELDLVLAETWDNVSEIRVHKRNDASIDKIRQFLINTAGKLRPGQGYEFNHYYITDDLVSEHGYRFYKGDQTIHVPAHLLWMDTWTGGCDYETFNVNKVFVADEQKINRKHRKHSDLKRWYELKKVNNSESGHVLKLTPRTTGQTPITYYTLALKIDDRSKAGYPFYVNAILESAIRSLMETHHNHTLEITPNDVIIDFAGDPTATKMFDYITAGERYPARIDSHPHVIYEHVGLKYWIYQGCDFSLQK